MHVTFLIAPVFFLRGAACRTREASEGHVLSDPLRDGSISWAASRLARYTRGEIIRKNAEFRYLFQTMRSENQSLRLSAMVRQGFACWIKFNGRLIYWANRTVRRMFPQCGAFTIAMVGRTSLAANDSTDRISRIAKVTTCRIDSRRRFLRTATTLMVSATVPSTRARGQKTTAKSERMGIGCIGLRYQGSVLAHQAQAYGDILALCDVDRHVREQARAAFGSTPRIYEDYRELLANPHIDVITIGSPDHWHAKMLIDACRAGKDVYCEKPLTLTIDEGKRIRDVVADTGRVVQVGSWQRSDHRFRLAVEMVRQGRIGKLQSVEVVLGKNKQGGPFATDDPPPELNWDLWQGQTPNVPFCHERSHYTFRWWYAYSGGQMTDWGAHHLDIAQWAIGDYPIRIESRAKFPRVENGYDVATDFEATYRYPEEIVMRVKDYGRNGVMLIGSEGRIFVNRGSLTGKAVDHLKVSPLTPEMYTQYEFDNRSRPQRKGKIDAIKNHMGNFFDCIESRKQPISDVESQHRSVSTCHLGNISMWENRSLNWDPKTERFIDDQAADRHLSREQRARYQVA